MGKFINGDIAPVSYLILNRQTDRASKHGYDERLPTGVSVVWVVQWYVAFVSVIKDNFPSISSI